MANYKNTYKGFYRVETPNKYRGDTTQIIWRSTWELRFMKWCDFNPSVIEWGSETIIIPYISPIDKRIHRYFVDFYIKIKDQNNLIKKYLIEIKPEKFTKPPEKPKRMTKKFLDEAFQYGVNEAKWKAALEFCEDRNMKFMILTEKHLGIKELKK